MEVLAGWSRRRSLAGLVVAASAFGCYAPDVRDCALSCGSNGDCASGQVCGADGLCAAPDLAGGCPTQVGDAGRDAGVDAEKHSQPDARPTDAPQEIVLTIMIMGPGSVQLVGGSSCSSMQPGNCELTAPADVTATLESVPDIGQEFDMWTMGPCMGEGATCMFVPMVDTMLAVHFKGI